MQLPFTREQFDAVFVAYNEGVWPAPVVLTLLALGCLVLSRRHSPSRSRIVAIVLALLWVWVAVAYHFAYFVAINPLAPAFGVLSLGAAIALILVGPIRGELDFGFTRTVRCYVGLVLVLYALVLYPLINYLAGLRFPAIPTFGLPCPVTIFTLGLLLCTRKVPPWWVLAIPVCWSLIGTVAAFQLGVLADLALLPSAALAVYFKMVEPRSGGEAIGARTARL